MIYTSQFPAAYLVIDLPPCWCESSLILRSSKHLELFSCRHHFCLHHVVFPRRSAVIALSELYSFSPLFLPQTFLSLLNCHNPTLVRSTWSTLMAFQKNNNGRKTTMAAGVPGYQLSDRRSTQFSLVGIPNWVSSTGVPTTSYDPNLWAILGNFDRCFSSIIYLSESLKFRARPSWRMRSPPLTFLLWNMKRCIVKIYQQWCWHVVTMQHLIFYSLVVSSHWDYLNHIKHVNQWHFHCCTQVHVMHKVGCEDTNQIYETNLLKCPLHIATFIYICIQLYAHQGSGLLTDFVVNSMLNLIF